RLATGGQDGSVHLLNPNAPDAPLSRGIGADWIEHLAWSPNPAAPPLLAAVCGSGIALLNPDATSAATLPAAPKNISALAWSPANTPLLAAAHFGAVRLLTPNGDVRQLPHTAPANTLAFSPDARWLAAANRDHSVRLWLNPSAPAPDTFQMTGFPNPLACLSFSNDSALLATDGGPDACVWDCRGTGPENRDPLMLPHDARIRALRFANQSPLLASASDDGGVQLAQILPSPVPGQPAAAKPLLAMRLPAPAVQIAFSPDDTHLALATSAGVLYCLKRAGRP
ncbi:MAG: WD40 repeat domain-containing protein, partial [Opitutaceae bacterium]|nr:WD40 repeat domain-containing protein [Opitutaceae bacterium]